MNSLGQLIRDLIPAGIEQWSARYLREDSKQLSARDGVLQPLRLGSDEGVMITVTRGGYQGYAATSVLDRTHLADAIQRAQAWAEVAVRAGLPSCEGYQIPKPNGDWHQGATIPWTDDSLGELAERIAQAAAVFHSESRTSGSEIGIWMISSEQRIWTGHGGYASQYIDMLVPQMNVVVADNGVVQQRSLYGVGFCRQGGLEVLDQLQFDDAPHGLLDEALALLHAPNCPTGTMDVLLAPDQMVLQVHESVGHPLELDRILGDERNYAGTSFVTPDMFGAYQYGSPLMNITFDPHVAGEFASYHFDDEGSTASRVPIIENGILMNPLGGSLSQHRAQRQGTANARATSWNRPPIDRMANLNMEPGTSSLDELIASVELGVMMKTNCSWSIDDSRNKFQFGCEWGQRIEKGVLKEVVRNPNYRGISSTFWRNLKGVGDASTHIALGSPFCGKGEPNQIIRVGHATPFALFGDVEVFGGLDA